MSTSMIKAEVDVTDKIETLQVGTYAYPQLSMFLCETSYMSVNSHSTNRNHDLISSQANGQLHTFICWHGSYPAVGPFHAYSYEQSGIGRRLTRRIS